MPVRKVEVERFSLTTSRPFESVVCACQRRLNIPQFSPVENSPLSPIENSPVAPVEIPQVQKDCRHAPAQQASACMFRGRISIIPFPSFRCLIGRSLGPPHPFQLSYLAMHVLPVVLTYRWFGDLLHKVGEVVEAGNEHGGVFRSVQPRC